MTERAGTESPPTELPTRRGRLQLPLFLPDATRAVVRGVRADDLAAVGVGALLVSAAHLAVRPGASVVGSAGGVHRFMGWEGPVVSDSGGFQAFSLRSQPGLLRVTTGGLRYRFSTASKFRRLTPESCIDAQLAIGADIVYCLDLCTDPGDPRAEQERSVELTLRWAEECRAAFDEATAGSEEDAPLLFAVVQGGPYEDLRARCAAGLVDIGFDGYGFGGVPVLKGALVDEVARLPALLPPGSILHGLGIGSPDHLVAAWRAGYRVFDCVLPTRNGRRGVLYTDLAEPGDERVARTAKLTDERWVRESGPVDPDCDCPVCGELSAAYLAHLFRIEDRLAATLGTLHNLRFYTRLVDRLRARPEP